VLADLIATVDPATTGPAAVAAIAGYALTGRAGLVDGQDLMNADARVYTALGVSGMSCADGNGLSFSPDDVGRRYAEWRASTVRIDPATVR
jgi:hypothetical protein